MKRPALGLVVLFIINAGLLVAYHQRTYPRASVLGVPVGNMSYADVAAKVQRARPLPDKLQFVSKQQHATAKTAELGITFDKQLAHEHVNASHSWLPIVAIFMHHDLPAPVRFDDGKLQQAAKKLAPAFQVAPKPTHIVWQDNKFTLADAKPGSALDTTKLQDAITRALTKGSGSVDAPLQSVAGRDGLSGDKAKAALDKVQPQLHTAITFSYQGASFAAAPQDVAGWFAPSGDAFVVSPAAVRASVAKAGNKLFGASPYNIDKATTDTVASVQNAEKTTIELKKFARTKTYTYCTAVRGVPASYLDGFNRLIASVYADGRGWNMDGRINFRHASSACDFTVWLSSAAQMHTFGAICDSTWDCNVGKSVVANLDRWEHGTSSWNAAHPGGAIDDYRTMLINHETGHQLGFYDNYTCGGKGQPAPIMLQQSINLRGCVFNIWPLPSELSTLRGMLGL